EVEVAVEVRVRIHDRDIAAQVDLLVFDGAPQSLDENIVERATLAIHGEPHAQIEQRLRELDRGELTTLVGVEDLRHAVRGDRAGHRAHAEGRVERVGQLPGEHAPAEPVDHGTQIDEATLDRDVG